VQASESEWWGEESYLCSLVPLPAGSSWWKSSGFHLLQGRGWRVGAEAMALPATQRHLHPRPSQLPLPLAILALRTDPVLTTSTRARTVWPASPPHRAFSKSQPKGPFWNSHATAGLLPLSQNSFSITGLCIAADLLDSLGLWVCG